MSSSCARAAKARTADRTLLEAGWDLGGAGAQLPALHSQLRAAASELLTARVTRRPETAFVIRTLLIHEYRKIHLRDPLLPRSVLPKDWIGATAYELCRDLYRKVFPPAEQHLSAVAETLAAAAHAGASDDSRFGGWTANRAALRSGRLRGYTAHAQ